MNNQWSNPSLELRSPWMNAAGSLGFAPDPRGPVSLEGFAAFVTNPISLRPRKAASPPRMLSFPGGVLLHTGHPNPGLRAAIKQYASSWARATLPVILHLLSDDAKSLRQAMPRLEELENVLAIELGLENEIRAAEAADLVRAASGELPIIVQVPLHSPLEFSEQLIEAGAAAISLAPPRGALRGQNGKAVNGRLYGPAVFPQALAAVSRLIAGGFQIIAAGGVDTKAQGEAMLAAGAMAVQIDVALWKGNWQTGA